MHLQREDYVKRLITVPLTSHSEAQGFAFLVSKHYQAKPGSSEECQEHPLHPVAAARNKAASEESAGHQ